MLHNGRDIISADHGVALVQRAVAVVAGLFLILRRSFTGHFTPVLELDFVRCGGRKHARHGAGHEGDDWEDQQETAHGIHGGGWGNNDKAKTRLSVILFILQVRDIFKRHNVVS